MTTQTKSNTNEIENGFSEAPASWNTRYIHPSGFECQITLRGDTGTELLEKVDKAIEYLLQNNCQPYTYSRNGASQSKANPNGKNDDASWCPIHECEMRRKHYNTVRPHSSLGYRPPAPETIVGVPSHIQQFGLTL